MRGGSDGGGFTPTDTSPTDSTPVNLDQSSSPSGLLSGSNPLSNNPFAHIGVSAANNSQFDPMSAYKSYTSSYINGQQGNFSNQTKPFGTLSFLYQSQTNFEINKL